MKIKKIYCCAVIGLICSSDGFLLVDEQGDFVVFTGMVGFRRLMAKKRDTNLLSSG